MLNRRLQHFSDIVALIILFTVPRFEIGQSETVSTSNSTSLRQHIRHVCSRHSFFYEIRTKARQNEPDVLQSVPEGTITYKYSAWAKTLFYFSPLCNLYFLMYARVGRSFLRSVGLSFRRSVVPQVCRSVGLSFRRSAGLSVPQLVNREKRWVKIRIAAAKETKVPVMVNHLIQYEQ